MKTLQTATGVALRLGIYTMLGFALFGFVGWASPVAAADAGDKKVEERVTDMERQIEELRAAVDQLRAAASKAGSPDTMATEIERKLDILAAEIERLKLGEEVVEADQSDHGMGPAASKIYRKSSGLSIGGYGEAIYQSFDSKRDDGVSSGKKDQIDFLRAIVYFGYKFNDRWLFNSEIEFEHASTGAGGEASVEFAYLDYLWKPELNARFGLLLVPMGFVNELHEPTVFLGARRPDIESVIIPSTWRENGAGIFGDVGGWSYRTYILNGFEADGFSSSGLRGGRQKGSRATAEDFAWVGRLDYTGRPGFLAGASAYFGNSGQGLTDAVGRGIDAQTSIVEGHVEWKWQGLQLRLLGVQAQVDDVRELNQALGLAGSGSIGEELEGFYAELGYDVLNSRAGGEKALVPFFRYESFDTQAKVPTGFLRNPARDVESLTLGLAYRPIDRLIFKVDYQDYKNEADTAVDQLNLAIGYVF